MDKKVFKSLLAMNGYTQSDLAKEMHMAESTLIRKVKNNSFSIAEAELFGSILHVTNLGEIFFHKSVT